MLEKLWRCLASGKKVLGHLLAGTTHTTSPSRIFFLGYTRTAVDPGCSPWEWTVVWSVQFVCFWSCSKLCVYILIFVCLVLKPDVLHIVQLKGGVSLGKQHFERTSHSKHQACWAERSTDVHGLVPIHQFGAVPPCCLRSVQDKTRWQRHQDVQVSKKSSRGLYTSHIRLERSNSKLVFFSPTPTLRLPEKKQKTKQKDSPWPNIRFSNQESFYPARD